MEGLTLFKTPSIYLIIERYLEWRDFLHIIQTCKELYYNWVSKDPERWKDLILPRLIYERILKIKIEANNPTQAIRERALASLLSTNKLFFHCMGICGKTVFIEAVVSRHLPHALCGECAIFFKSSFIERFLVSLRLSRNPEIVLLDYAYKRLGEESYKQAPRIIAFWRKNYMDVLKRDINWLFPVYSIEQIEQYSKELLDKMSL
jgi:hypothetical protein